MKHLKKLQVSRPKILNLQIRGFFHRNRENYLLMTVSFQKKNVKNEKNNESQRSTFKMSESNEELSDILKENYSKFGI
jgi:hypothetical protein